MKPLYTDKPRHLHTLWYSLQIVVQEGEFTLRVADFATDMAAKVIRQIV